MNQSKIERIIKDNAESLLKYTGNIVRRFERMLSGNVPSTLLCDFYKLCHREQYPDGTEMVYSTWTPRSNKHMPKAKEAISLGHQMMIKKLFITHFDDNFFKRPLSEVLAEYRRYMIHCLGIKKPHCRHLIDLHKLGYLPIEVKALPEGTRVPFRVPMLTIRNTDKRFAWLTNYLETMMSAEMWVPSTTATIADIYKQILTKYAEKTGGEVSFIPFQAHDFSMRGAMGVEASQLSGIGHLSSFVGTDTVPAIFAVERFYNGDIEAELIGCSVNATEHSVMCAGGKGDERETYRRLIQDVHPTSILSIVSDTWDLWNTVTNILPSLKDEIMERNGKVVIRPDSGDPVDIICGLSTHRSARLVDEDPGDPASKGLIQLLWDIFGGTVNDEGYKELDPHIGAIYGDSITPERCEEILQRLEAKGFASTNIVFGIGSFTYTYITRDSMGFAMKATMVVINGKEVQIFKDPATDDGTKKSNTGVVAVQEVDGKLVCVDGLSLNHEENDLMQTIFLDGELLVDDSFEDIRYRIASTMP